MYNSRRRLNNRRRDLYLVVGEEDLLRDHAIATLKGAVLGSDGDEFNYQLFYGDEASGSDIQNSVAAVPVFASRRLVVVKSAEKLTARDGDLLLDCVQNPVESTTLVFVSPKLDGRLKFSQALTRAAVIVDCSPLRELSCLPGFCEKQNGWGCGLRNVAQVLQEACGASLYGLRRELEKLASYVPSDRSVTVADVHLLRGVDPGASVFDLTLAIAEGDRGRVLSILARNLEAGSSSAHSWISCGSIDDSGKSKSCWPMAVGKGKPPGVCAWIHGRCAPFSSDFLRRIYSKHCGFFSTLMPSSKEGVAVVPEWCWKACC